MSEARGPSSSAALSVRDTCPCGSVFTISAKETGYGDTIDRKHTEWLKAHVACRVAVAKALAEGPEVPYPPTAARVPAAFEVATEGWTRCVAVGPNGRCIDTAFKGFDLCPEHEAEAATKGSQPPSPPNT